MAQELFTVIQSFESRGLFLRGAAQQELDVGMAKIGRNMNFSDVGGADARVGHLIADQLFQFFANAFRDTLGSMRVQVYSITRATRPPKHSRCLPAHETIAREDSRTN